VTPPVSTQFKTRVAVTLLTMSAAAFVARMQTEGYSDRAIIPTKGDVPTIGFGTTEGVAMGDSITPPVALERALRDVMKFEGALKTCVRAPLFQEEYDVYLDLSYNIGSGAFCSSRIVERINARDYQGACEGILMWKMYKKTDCSKPNKVCAGLWTNRLALHKRCMQAQL
jgi:lysozyme